MYLWLGGIIAGIVLAGAFADTGFRFAIPDDWETLLVGCIAWLSYLAVKRKTKHDKEVKGIVAKAALGNDLNAICTYAETVYELTYKILICYQAAEGINDKEPYNSLQTDIDLNNKALKEAISNFKTIPELDQGVIDRLAKAAAFQNSQNLLDLLNSYQVQHSRLINFIKDIKKAQSDDFSTLTTLDVESNLRDATRIYMLAERLFELPRSSIDGSSKEWNFDNDDFTQKELNLHLKFKLGYPIYEEHQQED